MWSFNGRLQQASVGRRWMLSCIGILLTGTTLRAQELYPYTEPASNMPQHSLSVKATAKVGQQEDNATMQRYIPEVMLGLSKRWMVHGAASLSDMRTSAVRPEGVSVYAKYRLLSQDAVHQHFRVALFGQAGYSRNRQHYDELNLMGDVSGWQSGVIVTALKNKWAVSGTSAFIQSLASAAGHVHAAITTQALNYSLSAGVLVLPVEYTSYEQTNLNLYLEALGQRSLNTDVYFLDLAPAAQLIFKSTAKLNLAYRFPVTGTATRSMRETVMVSFEYLFLNALKKKKSR